MKYNFLEARKVLISSLPCCQLPKSILHHVFTINFKSVLCILNFWDKTLSDLHFTNKGEQNLHRKLIQQSDGVYPNELETER